ncbi:MAG: hypothetical protein PHG49_03065 [Candidatus Pacebacteria bacterium]|nr:hypothetical protein [Candidatus Paceibacterota bacterium]
MIIEIQDKKSYIVIRDDNMSSFYIKKGAIENTIVNIGDIDMWIFTKSINNIPINKKTIVKLKQLKKNLVKKYSHSDIKPLERPKIEKNDSIKRKKMTTEKTKIPEILKIDIVERPPVVYIKINNSLLLTPNEFINFVHHALRKEITTTTKYKLTKTQIILHSNSKKELQIDEKIVKKAYHDLIDMGIKIPLHLKSAIDNIYRWQ